MFIASRVPTIPHRGNTLSDPLKCLFPLAFSVGRFSLIDQHAQRLK